jgi:hypothetical protein
VRRESSKEEREMSIKLCKGSAKDGGLKQVLLLNGTSNSLHIRCNKPAKHPQLRGRGKRDSFYKPARALNGQPSETTRIREGMKEMQSILKMYWHCLM